MGGSSFLGVTVGFTVAESKRVNKNSTDLSNQKLIGLLYQYGLKTILICISLGLCLHAGESMTDIPPGASQIMYFSAIGVLFAIFPVRLFFVIRLFTLQKTRLMLGIAVLNLAILMGVVVYNIMDLSNLSLP